MVSSGVRLAASVACTWLIVIGAAAAVVFWHEDLVRELRRLAEHVNPGAAGNSSGVSPPGNDDATSAPAEARARVELRAGSGGHFHAIARLAGADIDVMVDTGATMVALSYEDARRAGIFVRDSDFTQRVRTANGMASVAPVTLPRVTIGDITVANVEAVVSQPGRLATSLLGMTFLGRLGRAELRNGVLLLQE